MHRKLEHNFNTLHQNLPFVIFPSFLLILENSCELQFDLTLTVV